MVVIIFEFFASSITQGEAPCFSASDTINEEEKLSSHGFLILLLSGETST